MVGLFPYCLSPLGVPPIKSDPQMVRGGSAFQKHR